MLMLMMMIIDHFFISTLPFKKNYLKKNIFRKMANSRKVGVTKVKSLIKIDREYC